MSDDLSVEEIYNNMIEGLEIGIKDRQRLLTSQVDGLTYNQALWVLKVIINYPQENPRLKDRTTREQEFIASMTVLHEMQVQLEIQAIAQLQEEYQNYKEKKNG